MSVEGTDKPPIEFFESFIGFVNGKNPDTFFCVVMVLRWATPKNHHNAKKSIGGFTVIKTDKGLKKFYRWLRLTTHIGGFISCYRFTNGERTHRWFFNGYLRWLGLLGRCYIFICKCNSCDSRADASTRIKMSLKRRFNTIENYMGATEAAPYSSRKCEREDVEPPLKDEL